MAMRRPTTRLGSRPVSWTAVGVLVGMAACKQPSANLAPDRCAWSFVRYEPSSWETEWREGELSGERTDRECEVLATPSEIDRTVRLIRHNQDLMSRSKAIPPDSIGLYSRMVYAERCGPGQQPTGRQRVQLIEPLIGILRDPLTICPRPQGGPFDVYYSFSADESQEQSKRHLLIASAAPWSDTPSDANSWHLGGLEPSALDANTRRRSRARQNILMDIGASTYNGRNGDAGHVGARWFVDRYKRHNLAFDWIVSFESDKYDPDTLFQTVPPDVLPHYIYYNQGVDKSPNGKWNPWRILIGMGATRDDYVVIKLDIDPQEIENSLIAQLAEDPNLLSIIDEMFYEHRVNSKPMWPYWHTEGSPIILADTYRIFSALRSKGVRMHSWP